MAHKARRNFESDFGMKTTRRQLQLGKSLSSRFSWVALLLVFTLVLHAFETCSSHLGFSTPANSIQVFADCAHIEAASCDSCSVHQHRDSDGCDSQSEIAVLTSSFSPEQPDVVFVATLGVLPAPQHLVALTSGSLLGCAQPPPTHFVSSTLRSSLPNRAPPLA